MHEQESQEDARLHLGEVREGSSEEVTLRLDLEGSVGASQAEKQEFP